MKISESNFRRFGRVVFWLGVVVLLTVTLFPVSLDVQNVLVDKTWHFLSFSILTLLGLAAWEARHWPFILLISAGLGASIELLQAIPWIGRDADLQDWIADLAGVGLAGMVGIWMRR